MESLGDILRRITVKNTLRPTNGDGAPRPHSEPEVEVCADCRGSGWVSKKVPVGHPDFGQAFPCQCQQAKDPTSRIDSLRRYSNLGSLNRITFSSTRPDGPLPDVGSRNLFRRALDASVEFGDKPSGWLVLAGPSGSGKTHLAVAVANRCIERGETTLFIVVADLLDHLRATFSPDNPVSYDDLFEQVRNVPVLVLDDLGSQSTTPWAREKLFQVINHRFNRALPTVITVRGPLERLDEALRTRIESVPEFSRVFLLGQYNTRLARGIGELPADMRRRMTFAEFDVAGRRNATANDRESLEKARAAAETFAADPDRWILFTGPRGCGKTHLAVAIAGESLRRDRPVFYAFVPTLLDHLRATFSPNSPIGYDELFEQIKTVPLLVLDDLGAESSTAWAEEKLYQIVVHRHEARLPTVITSAFTSLEELQEAKPRIGSRLMDSLVVDWQPITAGNYRDQQRDVLPRQDRAGGGRQTRSVPGTRPPAPRRRRPPET
ncbi:MAG: ATP-binding protein [Chloroflexi bacterium]|nr:ATP-binding protein [Chloroflexota bacterium]